MSRAEHSPLRVEPSVCGPPRPPLESRADEVAQLAARALVIEAEHTVKPGLVDRRNCGAHDDMNLATFLASADALRPWWTAFTEAGSRYVPGTSPAELLACAREIGLTAEDDVFAATAGVNTHKGAIFALGLLCMAYGHVQSRQATAPCPRRDVRVSADDVCRLVAQMAEPLVQRELADIDTPRTAGERLYARHGLTGARGEAASGYARVREVGLPAYRCVLAASRSVESALNQAMLALLATNADTNLAHRGGVPAITRVRRRAQHMLRSGGVWAASYDSDVRAFDDDLIARNLSPGGCADLLAVTWLLAQLPDEASPFRPSSR